jgi:RNA recognition motif-containing protein
MLQEEPSSSDAGPDKSLKNGHATNAAQLREQQKQSEKDRTLFCIKIDPRCTEEILYELFLQVNIILN